METNSLIKIINKKISWEEAVQEGVMLLVNNGIATEELSEEIIKSTKELGPYYVLMPKVALAHTRPGSYNKSVGLSLILFKEPISFSDEERHNVQLLFTLSAIDNDSHIKVLQKFAELFNSQVDITEKAINAKNEKELYNLFKEVLNND